MSVPAKRRSRSKVRRNRAHYALKKMALNKCPKCGQPKRPHQACSFCGSYRGREIVRIKVKTKKEKK
ncbi:MAG: 50S ribosomal protein L32 [Patescibacteria group bacterium]|nr:50S ribosomal protein L32 [Patescibacteria group bacterium]